MHKDKQKFFRSINGILGKIGCKPNISVSLSLIAAHCNPLLLYGTESIHLNKAQMNSISYPFNSAYMKLFKSFDINIITASVCLWSAPIGLYYTWRLEDI